MQSEQLYRLTPQAKFDEYIPSSYTAIPTEAINEPQLNGDPLALLSVVCNLDQNGDALFSLQTIQAQCFYDPHRLQRAIALLLAAGYVEEVAR